jgi:hypothetical protein
MEPTPQPSLPPTYKELLKAMGEQLKSRKSALMKRALLIIWPYLLLLVGGYLFNQVINFNTLPQQSRAAIALFVVVYVIFSVIYSIIVGFVFEIEKRIWVDSFFDQKNLSLEESWRISKKLFWPAVVYRFKISLYFYIIPIFGSLAAIAALVALFIYSGTYDSATIGLTCFGALIVWVLGVCIYNVYARVILRYSWFVFLDNFGTSTTHTEYVSMIKKLNAVKKSETFIKALVTNFGTNSVEQIIKLAVGTVSFGVTNVLGGELGKMVGGAANIYGQTLARQAADLGNIAGQYILYRFARKEMYGDEQHVNETIYKL